MSRSSKNTLVELLRKNTNRSLAKATVEQREYRIVSSGEDGMIFFWNVLAPYSGNNLSHVESNDMRNPMSLHVKVQPQNVTIPRPVHQIHLTETG